jgi:hypothetical protein
MYHKNIETWLRIAHLLKWSRPRFISEYSPRFVEEPEKLFMRNASHAL